MSFKVNKEHLKKIENGEWVGKVVVENKTIIAHYVFGYASPRVYLLRQVDDDDTIHIDKYHLGTNYYRLVN